MAAPARPGPSQEDLNKVVVELHHKHQASTDGPIDWRGGSGGWGGRGEAPWGGRSAASVRLRGGSSLFPATSVGGGGESDLGRQAPGSLGACGLGPLMPLLCYQACFWHGVGRGPMASSQF